jgi:ribosome-associated protein
MNETTRNVVINREPVELFKILKFEGLTESGGEAKAAIEQGLVNVNGVVETRKRKQIVVGDVIEFGGETLRITLQQSGPETANETQAPRPSTPDPKKRRPRFSGSAS